MPQEPILSVTPAPPLPTALPTPTAGPPPTADPVAPVPQVPAPSDEASSAPTAPSAAAWGAGQPPVALVDSGSVTGLVAVDRGTDRLPVTPGVWASDQQVVVRLTRALTAVSPGSELLLRFADGTSISVAITGTHVMTTADAAASTSPLAVLAPAGEGRWHVTTAEPGKQLSPPDPAASGR